MDPGKPDAEKPAAPCSAPSRSEVVEVQELIKRAEVLEATGKSQEANAALLRDAGIDAAEKSVDTAGQFDRSRAAEIVLRPLDHRAN